MGAAVDGKNNFGNTALHLASAKGHLEMVHLLLEKGAVVEVKNEKREMALDVPKWKRSFRGCDIVVRERINEAHHMQAATTIAVNDVATVVMATQTEN
jgi:ankyrin repeat protein